jgi:hypothetical protein
MRPGRLPEDHPLEQEARRKLVQEPVTARPPDPDRPVPKRKKKASYGL